MSALPQPVKPRSIIYVDGFNLYYGAVRGGPYKWLNLQRYFELIRQGDDIQAINYFTALIQGPTRPNQDVFLRALDTLPLVNVVLGKFKAKRIKCTSPACSTVGGDRWFLGQEEKRTDVNIAISMLDDAYRDRCDRFVVVSGDSDLVPAINMVKSRFPRKTVIVYIPTRDPTRGAATEIRAAADRAHTLPLGLLKRAQFAATIADGAGGYLSKPASW